MKGKFKKGEVMLNTTRFLGYTKDENKNILIVPKEAEIIRRIYRECVSGKTFNDIAKGLECDGIPSPSYGCGEEGHKFEGKTWYSSTIRSILTNEKYKGDALLQKTFNSDFLEKRQKNKGQVEGFYVEECIPPIIDKELAKLVESELNHRQIIRGSGKNGNGKYSKKYPFSGLLICGNDGSKLRRHCQWNGDKRTPIWVCQRHQKLKDCNLLPIKESVLEDAFVEMLRRMLDDKESFISSFMENIETSLDDDNIIKLKEIEIEITEKSKYLIEINKKFRDNDLTREEYSIEFDRTSLEMDKLLQDKEVYKNKEQEYTHKNGRIEDMKSYLINAKTTNEFNGDLLVNLIERIKVTSKHEVIFELKCGEKIEM